MKADKRMDKAPNEYSGFEYQHVITTFTYMKLDLIISGAESRRDKPSMGCRVDEVAASCMQKWRETRIV